MSELSAAGRPVRPANTPPALKFLFPVLILAANLIVYVPSLHRMFVTDQIWYFADLEGSHSLLDGLRHYDYPQSRRYYKGDNSLFRPLLFSWVAVENWLFKYHYVYWNAANLALHLAVVFLLYRFLWRLRPSWFAGLFALFFSIAPGLIEMVMWNCIGGYLWSFLFFIASLGPLRRMAAGLGRGRDRWTYAAAMTLAVGFYEVMVPLSMLMAGYTALVARRRAARLSVGSWAALLVPAVLFTAVYLPHRVGREKVFYVHRKDGVENIMAFENSVRAVGRAAAAVGRWAGETFLPTAVDHQIVPYQRFGKRFVWTRDSAPYVINAALGIFLVLSAVLAFTRSAWMAEWPLALLMAGMAFTYALVIGFGRSLGDIVGVSYYLYFFTLVAVIGAYAVLDFDSAEWSRRMGLTLALEGFVLFSAILSFGMSQRVREANRVADTYFEQIVDLVDQNEDVPGFSFAPADSAYPASIDPIIFLADGYPTDPGVKDRAMRLSEIIFFKYYDERNPQFRVGLSP
ncbi:MAG: hypothetical protein HYT87_16715 [Nitrospirae bacterium]|nr:hypothetical protein [Nitrospirota bacterium]